MAIIALGKCLLKKKHNIFCIFKQPKGVLTKCLMKEVQSKVNTLTLNLKMYLA